jgi:hypothetical protein
MGGAGATLSDATDALRVDTLTKNDLYLNITAR